MSQSSNATQKVYNVIILDESGSMESIRSSIIRSFNELVQTMLGAEEKSKSEDKLQLHFISLYAFNGNGLRELFFQATVSSILPLTTDNYRPDASTPLYDAMGYSLLKHEKYIDGMEGAVTLVTILTDGEENASREYNREAIKALVDRLKAANWVFTYIGTDHDVSKASSSISITANISYQKDAPGVDDMLSIETRSRKMFYAKIMDKDFDISTANEDFYKDDEKSEEQKKP